MEIKIKQIYEAGIFLRGNGIDEPCVFDRSKPYCHVAQFFDTEVEAVNAANAWNLLRYGNIIKYLKDNSVEVKEDAEVSSGDSE